MIFRFRNLKLTRQINIFNENIEYPYQKKKKKRSDLSKQGTPLNAAFHRLRVSESFIAVDGDTPT